MTRINREMVQIFFSEFPPIPIFISLLPDQSFYDYTLTKPYQMLPKRLASARLISSTPLFSSPFIRFSSSPDSRPSSKRVLKLGDVLRETRVYSDLDVVEYSKLSLDINPIHLDGESARIAGFQGRIVHGMLVSSLFPRIIAAHFPGAVYASQTLHFKRPVYIGEEITGVVQTSNIRETKKKYLVKFLTRCINSQDHLVVEGEAVAIIPSLMMERIQHVDN